MLANVFLAIAGAAVLSIPSQTDLKTTLQERIGVVAIRAAGCHFVTHNDRVPAGSEITIIDPDSGGAPLILRATARIKRPQWPQHPWVSFGDDRPEPAVYSLDCSEVPASVRIAGLGVIAFQGTITRVDRGVVAKFSGSGVGEYAYRCTGSESLQFIIRSLDKRSLLWRAAYYLGYDTEPSCRAEDFR